MYLSFDYRLLHFPPNTRPELFISSDMIFNAWVFSFKVWVTTLFGFLTKLPRVELAHLSSYLDLHKVETGDFCLTIFSSNYGAPTVFESSSRKVALTLLLQNLTLQKPNARSMFLSYLIKSLIAKNKVLKASLTTSTPSIAAAATGTGFA